MHKEELSKGTHHNKGLQKDYDKGDIFTLEVIKVVGNHKELDDEERAEIARHNTFYQGYNNTPGGEYDNHRGIWDSKAKGRLPKWKYQEMGEMPKNLIGKIFKASYAVNVPFESKINVSSFSNGELYNKCPNCGRILHEPVEVCLWCGYDYKTGKAKHNSRIERCEVHAENENNNERIKLHNKGHFDHITLTFKSALPEKKLIKCPSCGNYASNYMRKCPCCNHNFEKEVSGTDNPGNITTLGARHGNQYKHCPKCNKLNESYHKFCVWCGEKF